MAENAPTTPPAPTAPPAAVTPPAATAPVTPPAAVDWTPPTREEWEDTTGKLSAANKEAAGRRTELNKLKQQHETDAEKAQREAAEQATQTLRPKLLNLTGQLASAFKEARSERLGALLKLVDFDKVDTDSLSGLGDEVTRLKTEFPEFFGAAQQGAGHQAAGRAEMGGRKPDGGVAMSPMDALVAQALGTNQ